MKCPLCNVELKITDRQGIEIDYCTQCRGIWLDRGELDKIIERSEKQYSNNNDVMYQEKNYKDSYKYKKKKSIIGEIFDF